jgi:hypothetical protein
VGKASALVWVGGVRMSNIDCGNGGQSAETRRAMIWWSSTVIPYRTVLIPIIRRVSGFVTLIPVNKSMGWCVQMLMKCLPPSPYPA